MSRLTVDAYVDGVRAGDRAVLARAVTLVESNLPSDRELAQTVLERLLPLTGGALRLGISGPPGVGKSTMIEALGLRLLAEGRRLAVLAVDPSSSLTGGSILGDKTRMPSLATDRRAFVRPSPSDGALGGVHRKTRETTLLVEAAGYDVVIIETVGVGQSEQDVAGMVDTFLLLMLPGSGDEVQGIKRGVLELADVIAVTKADGDQAALARVAQQQLLAAMRLMRPSVDGLKPSVELCSAVSGEGLDRVWAAVLAHRAATKASGRLLQRRGEQRARWLWEMIERELIAELRADPAVAALREELEPAVARGAEPAARAAERLLRAFLDGRRGGLR